MNVCREKTSAVMLLFLLDLPYKWGLTWFLTSKDQCTKHSNCGFSFLAGADWHFSQLKWQMSLSYRLSLINNNSVSSDDASKPLISSSGETVSNRRCIILSRHCSTRLVISPGRLIVCHGSVVRMVDLSMRGISFIFDLEHVPSLNV